MMCMPRNHRDSQRVPCFSVAILLVAIVFKFMKKEIKSEIHERFEYEN